MLVFLPVVLGELLYPKLSKSCVHLPGNGGAKGAVRDIHDNLPDYEFVFRSDVKSYYASINHVILMEQLWELLPDASVLRLVYDYLQHTVCDGGNYIDITRGLSRGCPLSPLMGAVYLNKLDERMEKTGLFYIRFMDDWIVLSPTRWKLRKAVRIANKTLAELAVVKHPDKTFIGKTSKGFDFLGYYFKPGKLAVSKSSFNRFMKKISRLYEQGADTNRVREETWDRHSIIQLGTGTLCLDKIKIP